MNYFNRLIISVTILTAMLNGVAYSQDSNKDPWTGKYPMSFFRRARSANTVGKDKLSIGLKYISYGADDIFVDGGYCDLPEESKFDKFMTVTTLKYGWAENHHIALGIPYTWVDFENSKKEIDSNGFANIFVFEKWKFLQETKICPAMAFDVWYFFPTGDTDEKLGNSDSSIRINTEISKAWKYMSAHLMPGYLWNIDGGVDVGLMDAALLVPLNKKFLLGLEYNYTNKDDKDMGDCHDILPGFIFKPFKGASVKLAAIINIDSDYKYRDEVGIAAKAFYKIAL